MTAAAAPARRRFRSVGAILAGLMLVFVCSLAVDQLLHLLGVYPPWGEPMHAPGLNALALSYRLLIGVAGGYLTARLAPRAPVAHALVLGGIGLALSLGGVAVALKVDLGPLWYPIALAASALPTSWLGGWLAERRGAR